MIFGKNVISFLFSPNFSQGEEEQAMCGQSHFLLTSRLKHLINLLTKKKSIILNIIINDFLS
jgi:hypothetical protein